MEWAGHVVRTGTREMHIQHFNIITSQYQNNERIIAEYNKRDTWVWIGLKWHRAETSGGFFCTRKSTVGFDVLGRESHAELRNCQLVKKDSAPQ
jgi:hypothetical protein